jgi:hypothetical protein
MSNRGEGIQSSEPHLIACKCALCSQHTVFLSDLLVTEEGVVRDQQRGNQGYEVPGGFISPQRQVFCDRAHCYADYCQD